MELRGARLAAYRRLLDEHLGIPPVEQAQGAGQGRLGLHGHHPGTETAKAGHPVTHMAADVEGEIPGPDEASIELVHGLPAGAGLGA